MNVGTRKQEQGTRPRPAQRARSLASALSPAGQRLRDGGIDDSRIEAELLLCHALGIAREQLYARLRDPLAPGDGAAFEALLDRRLAHEPSAYITGRREFYGLDLECTPAALIPRPETELLVEEALRGIPDLPYPAQKQSPLPCPLVVDVGTGCGAIAIAIAAQAPHARVIAIDTSAAALDLARRNAGAHGVADRIEFVQGDLLAPLREPAGLILANLPYIPTLLYEALPPEIREHEPPAALHAGPRGTELIERLLEQASACLRPGGLLLLEHAWDQAARLREAARRAFPNARIETKRDLAGWERMLLVAT